MRNVTLQTCVEAQGQPKNVFVDMALHTKKCCKGGACQHAPFESALARNEIKTEKEIKRVPQTCLQSISVDEEKVKESGSKTPSRIASDSGNPSLKCCVKENKMLNYKRRRPRAREGKEGQTQRLFIECRGIVVACTDSMLFRC